MGKEPKKSPFYKIIQQEVVPGKQSVQRAAYPKDELKFKSFSSSPVLT